MMSAIQGLKFELVYPVEQSKKMGLRCDRCKGLVGPMMKEQGTQSLRKSEVERLTWEEIKNGLENRIEIGR